MARVFDLADGGLLVIPSDTSIRVTFGADRIYGESASLRIVRMREAVDRLQLLADAIDRESQREPKEND